MRACAGCDDTFDTFDTKFQNIALKINKFILFFALVLFTLVSKETRSLHPCAPGGAQAFLLPANVETERGVKTIDKARSLISNF